MTKDELREARDNMLESIDSLREDINGEFETFIEEAEEVDDLEEIVEKINYIPHPDTIKIVNRITIAVCVICATVLAVTLLLGK